MAGEATIRAAWAADDARNDALAAACRRDAADLLLPLSSPGPACISDEAPGVGDQLLDLRARALNPQHGHSWCSFSSLT